MSACYPIHLNVRDRLCVVVGGGGVAERRVYGLLEAQARVRVVAPKVTSKLAQWAAEGYIVYLPEPFQPNHVEGAFLVFAATNVRVVNALVARSAREKGILVNVADMPDEGDFLVPSVVRRGELCLSVATGGNLPMLTAQIADELAELYGAEYEPLVALLGKLREEILQATGSNEACRKEALSALKALIPQMLHTLRDGCNPEPAVRTALASWLAPADPHEERAK